MSELLDSIIETYEEEEFLTADGFDEAIIGLESKTMRLIYSYTKCIEILESQGMEHMEALEFFEYNTIDAYVGSKTPIFCEDFF